MRCGMGVLERNNGDRYEGEWERDMIHGKGHFTRKNNDYFNGEWFENTIHGFGVSI
jgi:hypothetical protein